MMKIIVLLLLCSQERWQLVGFENEIILCIAVHPECPDTLFVGFKKYLCKSVDGGATWDTVLNIPSPSRIIFDPDNPNTMYAIGGEGSLSDGIYRSWNGGKTWNAILYKRYGSSIAISTYHGRTLVAGFKGEGVYRSDDTGTTWYPMNDSLDNLNVLSIATINPYDSVPIFLCGTEGGLYSYSGHWIRRSIELQGSSISIYSDYYPVIYAALSGGSNSDGIYKSTDYGATWSVATYWIYSTFVLINLLDSSIVYAANFGDGVKISRDGGLTWSYMNEGLGDGNVLYLAQSPKDTSKLYAGTMSGIYVYNFYQGVEEKHKEMPNLSFSPISYKGSDVIIKCWIPDELVGKTFELKIYDVSGRIVETLFKGKARYKLNSFTWRKNINRGLFFIHLKIKNKRLIKKLIIL